MTLQFVELYLSCTCGCGCCPSVDILDGLFELLEGSVMHLQIAVLDKQGVTRCENYICHARIAI